MMIRIFKSGTLIFFVSLVFSFVTMSCSSTAQQKEMHEIVIEDTLKSQKPVLHVEPEEIIAYYDDTTKFVMDEVTIFNKGGGKLYINYIDGSCSCATATILKNNLKAGESAKIRLAVNLKGLYDENNVVIFYVYSNAEDSPYSIKVTLFPSD